jgi:hypothetical protein
MDKHVATFKTCWEKYKTFIANMVANCGSMEFSKANLLNLCHIDIILGVPCILPMLEF